MKKTVGLAVLSLVWMWMEVNAGGPVLPASVEGLQRQVQASFADERQAERFISLLQTYYATGNPQMHKGLTLLLDDHYFDDGFWSIRRKPNEGLRLLAHLLEQGAYVPGDSMSLALAIANGHLYALADEPTRQAIRADVVDHFAHYKRVLAWQKGMRVNYDLSRVPLIPQIYWAHRLRTLDLFRKIKVLRLSQYREFVDRIDNLAFMHELLERHALAEADSLQSIARNIEAFTGEHLLYRAKLAQHRKKLDSDPDNSNALQALKEYDEGKYTQLFQGKKRRWDLFYWLNHQVDIYRDNGYFRGDCVTETTFQMNLYRAAGIPAMANQVRPVSKSGYSHNSPLYYNPFFDKWDSIQYPPDRQARYYLHFEKPIWSHLRFDKDGPKRRTRGRQVFSSYWQAEEGSAAQLRALRKRGFEGERFEALFLSDETHKPGLILNALTAPAQLVDTDNDGILDGFEAGVHTDSRSPDTDGDGFADLLELEWGFNPVDAASRPPEDRPVIDGLSENEIRLFNIPQVSDPAGDYRADAQIHDIASLGVKRIGDSLYAAVSFHNDISGNSRDVHTLVISARGADGQQRKAVQWVNGKAHVYEIGKKEWLRQDASQQAFSLATVRDTEMMIPLSLFARPAELRVHYRSSGKLGNKFINRSDVSGTVQLDYR
jgi:hypothetical protein